MFKNIEVRSVVRWVRAAEEHHKRQKTFAVGYTGLGSMKNVGSVRTVTPAPMVLHGVCLTLHTGFASSPDARRPAVSLSGAAMRAECGAL